MVAFIAFENSYREGYGVAVWVLMVLRDVHLIASTVFPDIRLVKPAGHRLEQFAEEFGGLVKENTFSFVNSLVGLNSGGFGSSFYTDWKEN
ncbi:hypothetical protein [Hahella ganghwensis]|uniref:hypothetical protein n=1 Tax=Hahella ganghwensis TaxID=286420 RepID=UPI00036AFD99|nr:hypothetical protein [Hahella ganghwensis]